MKDKLTTEEYRTFLKTGKLTTDEPAPQKSKYGNKRKVIDGLKFDSTREANRFSQLMLMHKAGMISKPILQYEFVLTGCTYVCDFLYLDYQTKQFVVEDSKGCRTDVYKLKRKQMLELYEIEIKET